MTLALLLSVTLPCIAAQEKTSPHPTLFLEKGELVYSDHFKGKLDSNVWEARQQTQWTIKGEQLVGSPSPKAYQQEMIEKGQPGYSGDHPVARLNGVPQEFICHMRLRYEGNDYTRIRPLLDVGHHKNSFLFSAKNTRMAVDKDKQIMDRPYPMLPLNTWVYVTIEFKQGRMALKMNDHLEVYESQLITMAGQREFTFKGIPGGRIVIDYVRLWEVDSTN